MTPADLLRFCLQALSGHRLRTALSLLGMAIGVAAVITLTALGEGARRYVIDQFASIGSNLLIVVPGKTETTGIPGVAAAANDLTLEDSRALDRSIPEAEQVAPFVIGTETARGTRGMMRASEYARLHRVPFFGICYGFQWATVEFARNVCMLDGADSTEVDEAAPHKVIYKLRDLLGVDDLGGTMRLGKYDCDLLPGSLARTVYGTDRITERHRHRFEFNCLYEPALREKGMRISGRSPDGKFVEIAELPGHPWFLAVQFHPEFQSRPLKPHPLFASFVAAAYQQKLAAEGRTLDAKSLA